VPLYEAYANDRNDSTWCTQRVPDAYACSWLPRSSCVCMNHKLIGPDRASELPHSTMELTTPAPTVRPPSRIAKRRPCSMAIGVINSTSIATLSPGITISVPSGRVAAPVTSVVRK